MEILPIFLESREYALMKKKYEKSWFKLKGNYVNITDDNEFIEYKLGDIAEYFINKNIKIKNTKETRKKTADGEEDVQQKTKLYTRSFFKYGDMTKTLKLTIKLNFVQISKMFHQWYIIYLLVSIILNIYNLLMLI
jgi:hypothetical protein